MAQHRALVAPRVQKKNQDLSATRERCLLGYRNKDCARERAQGLSGVYAEIRNRSCVPQSR